MVPHHQHIGSQFGLRRQHRFFHLGFGIPHKEESGIPVGDAQHQRIIIEVFPSGAPGGTEDGDSGIAKRDRIPGKEIGGGDGLFRQGIQ